MVYEYLPIGKDNAVNAQALCSMLHLTKRQLSKHIEIERRSGKPICASTDGAAKGYFIPESREEMERYCRSLLHRGGEIFKTRRACMDAMKSLPSKADPGTPVKAAPDRPENTYP